MIYDIALIFRINNSHPMSERNHLNNEQADMGQNMPIQEILNFSFKHGADLQYLS